MSLLLYSKPIIRWSGTQSEVEELSPFKTNSWLVQLYWSGTISVVPNKTIQWWLLSRLAWWGCGITWPEKKISKQWESLREMCEKWHFVAQSVNSGKGLPYVVFNVQ
jgi:hypothetical protein